MVETGSAELSVFPSCLRPMRSMPFIVDEVRNVWSKRVGREERGQGKKAEESGEQRSLDAALEGR